MGNWDEDDDGLLAATDIDLAGSGDLEGTELSLELGNRILEVNQGLRDGNLGLIWGSLWRVGRAVDLVLDGHVDS